MIKKHIILLSLLLALLVSVLSGCNNQSLKAETEAGAEAEAENLQPDSVLSECNELSSEAEAENMQKLAMVWGFAKYTHQAFLTGERCWDDELLGLIPIVRAAHSEDVNIILYNWFISLGDDGYDNTKPDDVNDTVQRAQADMGWVNETFLGRTLYLKLSRFDRINLVDRSGAPVSFSSPHGIPDFSNEKSHTSMAFDSTDYRLLGLFRMWNAMLYYYPNMDIIDYCWFESLLEYIPLIQEGIDRRSYESTLLSLARKLDDAHMNIGGRNTHGSDRFDTSGVMSSHVLLDNNIGLINPLLHVYQRSSIQQIMDDLAETDGLIIDLRQYPCHSMVYDLADYIVEERTRFVLMTHPDKSIPGSFVYVHDPSNTWFYSGGLVNPHAFFYEKPVAILMSRSTFSAGEFAVMSLRNGNNVTVMGSNSIGANGNVAVLPLPGNTQLFFTSIGVFTPEGGQTHRIGLAPDIPVEPTAEGIREGRDELMEAAMMYLLERVTLIA